MQHSSRPFVLVTGAAGRIGTAFCEDAGEGFRLRRADLRALSPPEAARADDEMIELDITDLDACRRACSGVDAVLHLAGDPDPDADFYGSLLRTNIVGTYNIFRAAKEAGCGKVVFASSAQAIEAYPLERQVGTNDPVRPKNLYGVSKCFGEALASYYADIEGLSAIAVRIANYNSFVRGEQHSARDISAYLSRRDAVQLLSLCLLSPLEGFAIVNGVSNNRFKRLDLVSTRALLGYAPVDDAFDILGFGLPEG